MTNAKTKMTVERAETGLWLVSVEAEWPDGQFFSFAVTYGAISTL